MAPWSGEGHPPPGGKRGSRAASAVGAGGPAVSLLHSVGEAASRVRSHISPGPYRSFRELSLAGSVDPDTWCPPTFVGNSGIECFNGHRGFALLVFWTSGRPAGPRPQRAP